jgi:acetoin utilization protein AcuB
MGAREMGVRVTALMHEEHGQLAKLTQAISNEGGNFIALGTFSGEDPSNRTVTFKVSDLDMEKIKSITEPLVERLIDIRICCD